MVLFPGAQGTLYAALLLLSLRYCYSHYRTGFQKVTNSIELSKPSVTSSLSSKDERIAKSAFPKKQQVSLPAFSSNYMLNAKEGICEYPLVIYR